MGTTSDAQVPTLIAARPGLMRDSLLAFLRATRRIKVVAVVDDPAAALEATCHHQPHSLVVDADLSEEAVLAVVGQLSAELPALNIVALVHGFRQQRAFLAAGAGHALLKGHLDQRLWTAVLDMPVSSDRPNKFDT